MLPEFLLKFLPIVCYENESEGGTPDPSDNDTSNEGDAEAEALKAANKDLNPHEDALYNDDGTAKKPEQQTDDKESESDQDDEGSESDKDDKDGDGDEQAVSKNGVEKPQDLKTVPEDGKYYIEIPEDMDMDTELLDSVSDLWKEKGVTHEEAQQLANQYIANLEKKAGQAEEDAFQQREDDIQKWVDETKADKEVGGDKLSTTLTNGRKALNTYGSDDLKQLLETSGLGSNVHMIKFMSKVGAALGDDDIPDEDPAKPNMSDTPIEEQLYGDITK